MNDSFTHAIWDIKIPMYNFKLLHWLTIIILLNFEQGYSSKRSKETIEIKVILVDHTCSLTVWLHL